MERPDRIVATLIRQKISLSQYTSQYDFHDPNTKYGVHRKYMIYMKITTKSHINNKKLNTKQQTLFSKGYNIF